MRILIADTTMSGNLIGGAQFFLVELLGGLVSRGHEVHLVTGGRINERIREPIERTGAALHTEFALESRIMDEVGVRAAAWVTNLNPEVYVVSVSPDVGWVTLPHLGPEVGVVNIAHSNGYEFYDPLKHYSRFVNRSVGVSSEICGMFESYCGVTREKIDWIPYGVTPGPTVRLNDSVGTLKIVYVGRLAEPDKKVSDLIKIVQRLRTTDLDYSLNVIGDGPVMPLFQKELADEIGTGRVCMSGWLAKPTVLQCLRESSVSLLVSESEGFPIALVEAMANGCCPIVTDIESGNKQLVQDGVNGFVVPVGDIGAFVDRIKFLASDRERLSEMRVKAWETGKEYSVDRMVSNYISCFEGAIEDAERNPRTPDPKFPLMESCRSKYPLWVRRLKAKAKALVTT
jgi:glycosyltransferase involved in cell wall biosynthesis